MFKTKIAALVISTASALFAGAAMADYYSDWKAVSRILDISDATPPPDRYRLIGVQDAVENCYSSYNRTPDALLFRQCAIFDLTGYKIAAIMQNMGFPSPNQYFNKEIFKGRLLSAMKPYFSDRDVPDFINYTNELVEKAMGERSRR